MSNSLFEYKVRARHRLGWKEFSFYATTDIEEFLNRNSIDYVRNATDTVENRLFKENKRLNNIINKVKQQLLNKKDIVEKSKYFKLVYYTDWNMEHEWDKSIVDKIDEIINIIDEENK